MSNRIRIFAGSPGDVEKEKESLAGVIDELNRTISSLVPHKPTLLELITWKTHTYPAGGRPQGVINMQIGDYDIFLGIMWKRFGTPTGEALSGTEEEYTRAFENWKKSGKPHLMFYFC